MKSKIAIPVLASIALAQSAFAQSNISIYGIAKVDCQVEAQKIYASIIAKLFSDH